MKKLSSITKVFLIALVLFFTVQTGVSADSPIGSVALDGYSTTINNVKIDDGFAFYKVFDITYNAANNTVTNSFTTAAQAFINSGGSGYTGLTVKQYQAYDETQVKAFLGKFAKYVKATPVTPNKTATATSTTLSVDKLEKGQYMILGTGNASGAYIYQIMTANFKPDAQYNINTGATLDCKISTPTIDKDVSDADKQVAIGDTITYTITVPVPTYPADATFTKYTVTDAAPAGVTFAATTSVKSGTTTIPANAYTATASSWVFDYSKISAYAGTNIVITYTATVNSNIVIGAANTNTATLTYSSDPYGDKTSTVTDTAKIYSYGIEILKLDKDDAGKKLDAAQFNLYKGAAGTGTVIGIITTGADGIGTWKGLDVGTYSLVEIKAPTGYILDATPIVITITDSLTDTATIGIVDVSGATTAGYVAKTLTNEKGTFTLPSTGGIGTWVFTIVGIVVMSVAVAVLVASSRKKRQQSAK